MMPLSGQYAVFVAHSHPHSFSSRFYQFPMKKTKKSHWSGIFPKEDYPPLTPPMKALMADLRVILSNPVVEASYNEAIANLDPYVSELGVSMENPWADTTVEDFADFYEYSASIQRFQSEMGLPSSARGRLPAWT